MTTPMSDAELAGQPAAYWTGVAYESLIAFTRARQAERGFTQPQFWLLRHLSPDGDGMSVAELRRAMRSYLRAEDDLTAEAETLIGRGWLTRDERDRLWITESGEAAPGGARPGDPRRHPPRHHRRGLRHHPQGAPLDDPQHGWPAGLISWRRPDGRACR